MSFGKKDICINISSKALIPKDKSKDFFEAFLNLVSSKSKSKVVKISNFGTFYCKNTPQRLGRNPKTKEEFIITKRSKLCFKPSNKIRSIIN
ncbi:HU family DNA-binding protein [Gammaproteobacteria bacterium]|nr:HU family DNA-binding protein [Gammaproteobacteria bacterium]